MRRRRLSNIRREQIKTMIALKAMRKMDREVSAIVGKDFDPTLCLATMTSSRGFWGVVQPKDVNDVPSVRHRPGLRS